MLELLDTTLREGEQCYGVFFSLETKVSLALLLDELGVDFIEAGHPAAAPSLREAAAAIARLDLRARAIGHARMLSEEIRLVRAAGLTWVGLFSGINAFSRERYGCSRKRIFERIATAVCHAKDIGLSVKFTCEDASRTDLGELVELYERLRELGADRMSYADTVGTDTPAKLETFARRLGSSVGFPDLHFHFHDDRGLAFANAQKAAALGARCIDASIQGVGERMGLVPLEKALGLRPDGGSDLFARTSALRRASALVASSIDQRRFEQRRFAHKSGVHIHGVCRDPRSYEAGEPAADDEQRLIILSKLIGRAGLCALLARCGFQATESVVERLLMTVKHEDRMELAEKDEIERFFERCGVNRQVAC